MLAPGDDSFQNEYIAKAGGQAPRFGRNGAAIVVSPEQWREFNPETIYYCGHDSAWLTDMLRAEPWNTVDAVRAGRLLRFPCDPICRAATQYGEFSLWLASALHGEAFAKPEHQLEPDAILSRKPLHLPFDYVAAAEVSEERLFDFRGKSLVLRFKRAQTALSSLSGWSDGITAVGNRYSEPSSWASAHYLGFEATNTRTLAALKLAPERTFFLYTGADMANLAYAEYESEGLRAGVFATAGARGNALRAGTDAGDFVEPGTINLIVLTNRRLTPAARTQAMILSTEAKTAALEDRDIRSSFTGRPATGTGTDNVIVVGGEGAPAAMAGGHTKLGELVAKAVHQAVREAVWKQDRIDGARSIFQRLAERRINPGSLLERSGCLTALADRRKLGEALEHLLLEPRYAGFLEAALAVSDSAERGLLTDDSALFSWRLAVAGDIAGKPVSALDDIIGEGQAPEGLREALNALCTGLRLKLGMIL
jgi:adenosylcobinamide amidohydrolase